MPQWSVNIRQRKAPLRGAWVRYCAVRTRCAQRGWPSGAPAPDNSGVRTEPINNRVINNLSHTFSTPGNNPVIWD